MAVQLQAGVLDTRITIQRVSYTDGDYHDQIETWSDLAEVWAGKRDLSTTEAYRAQEIGAQITTRFTIRYSLLSATITPIDRISHKGKLYNIVAVKEVAGTRNAWLEIDAAARADK